MMITLHSPAAGTWAPAPSAARKPQILKSLELLKKVVLKWVCAQIKVFLFSIPSE